MKASREKIKIERYDALNIGPRWISRRELATETSSIVSPPLLQEETLSEPPQTPASLSIEPSLLLKTHLLNDWEELEKAVVNCQRCPLASQRTQTVFGVGNKKAKLMIVGEAPGAEEDRQGKPFVGLAGKLLDNMLASINMTREDDVFIANVLKCRPPQNRNPQPDEVAKCHSYLENQIALVNPTLILAVGRYAINSLLKTEAPISALRGKIHQYENIPVIVTYHPAYLLRNLPDKLKAWQDLVLVQKTLMQSVQRVTLSE